MGQISNFWWMRKESGLHPVSHPLLRLGPENEEPGLLSLVRAPLGTAIFRLRDGLHRHPLGLLPAIALPVSVREACEQLAGG